MLRSPVAPLRQRFQVLRALRHKNFRFYWIGLLASVTGYQMVMNFGLMWLIYDLTGKPLYLGYIGLVNAVPTILLNLFGGAFADRVNPKRLLGVCQFSSALVVVALALLSITGLLEPWHVLGVSFLIGAVQAFDSPVRQSIFPRLVNREDIPNAVAMISFIWQGTTVIAPAIAGILVARANIATVLFLSAAGFLALSVLAQIMTVPPVKRVRGNVFNEIMEGFEFIKENSVFAILIGITFFSSMFGWSYMYLMPVFAKDILEVGSEGMGFLMGASGIGAIVGTFTVASIGKFQRRGWLIIMGATFFGAFLILFAISPWYLLSLVLLFMAGMSSSFYLFSVMSTLQLLVPDEFRGRVMGFYTITWSLAPLGAMQSGAIADFLGAPFAVGLGGGLVMAFALGVGLSNPRVRRLRATA